MKHEKTMSFPSVFIGNLLALHIISIKIDLTQFIISQNNFPLNFQFYFLYCDTIYRIFFVILKDYVCDD